MKKGVCFVFFLLIFGTAASADILFSYPKIANRETNRIELGASPQMTVRYKNAGSAPIYVTFAEIYLGYDARLVDAVIDVKNENPENLKLKEMDISTPGEIRCKMETSPLDPKPILVKPGVTVDLATVTFHVNQSATPARWVNLLSWSTVIPSIVRYKTADVTGGTTGSPAVYLDPSYPPSFSGLSRAISANAQGVSNPGNTVLLDWVTPGTGAYDRTKYYNNKLSYRVYRDLDSSLSAATEFTVEPDHYVDGDPAGRIPYTSNVEGKDYVYEDTGLDDGTVYYYKVTVLDDTSPNPNVNSATTVLKAIPLDLTPPGEVFNLTATPNDNRVILRWENPSDADLGGAVIMRNKDNPVGAGSLGQAQAVYPFNHGPEYFIGDQPLGPDGGTIIFVSPQEYDPTAVPTEYEDLDAVNGTVYHYKVFTYDRAVDGSPREMGRNYSNGITISRAAGIPPRPVTNFTATRGIAPGEVIFNWENSPDDFCDGVMIRYSTDDNLKFFALRDERSGSLVDVFPRTAGPGDPESATLTFPSGWTYYFKAFAYNYTPEGLNPEDPASMARHLFSAGQPAAVNLPAEEAEILFTYEYAFQPGINHFAVPFPAERVVDEFGRTLDISTWEKLIDVINSQSRAQTGENAVTTFGQWNAAKQEAEGIVDIDYSKTGLDRFFYTPGISPNNPIIQGGAYEIAVSRPFTFTLRAIVPRTR